MIEKLAIPDTINPLDFPIAKKLNEVIDYLNKQKELDRLKKVEQMISIVEPKVVPDYAAHLKLGEMCEVPISQAESAAKIKEGMQRFADYEKAREYARQYEKETIKQMSGIWTDEGLETEKFTSYCVVCWCEPCQCKPKSKWKIGDTAYYVLLNTNHGFSEIRTTICANNGDYNNYNYFKTREQAEAALAEIKEVLARYQ
jgi:hypothetical protein